MMKKIRFEFPVILATLVVTGFTFHTTQAKPLKVYILAGQSNMVGMGEIGGAKNLYNGVYLTTDPAAPKGPLEIFKVGKYLIDPLAVYLPDGTATD